MVGFCIPEVHKWVVSGQISRLEFRWRHQTVSNLMDKGRVSAGPMQASRTHVIGGD